MHPPSLVNLIPFPPCSFMKTLTSSCRPSPTHLLPLALYHVIWRLPLVSDLKTATVINLCWKSHHLIKIFWKNTAPYTTFHFCPKSLKKAFSTNFSHLQENNLTNPFLSAYRAGHSAGTVLLRVVNDILSTLDNDSISVPFFDLSAAFDTTDHQILLSCPNSVFGIQSTALQWF